MTAATPSLRDLNTPQQAPAKPAAHSRSLQVALVGNPNAGKSTLFNALTGARAKVMNAPGTTVELQKGTWQSGINDSLSNKSLGFSNHNLNIELIDLPGTYSLIARSPDERVTSSFIQEGADLIVVILDATALARSLYLLSQVLDTGIPVIAAITMLDVAATRGVRPDLTALADGIGVPLVAVDPRSGTGLSAFIATMTKQLQLSATQPSTEQGCECDHHAIEERDGVGWPKYQAAGKYFALKEPRTRVRSATSNVAGGGNAATNHQKKCRCGNTLGTAAIEPNTDANDPQFDTEAADRFAWTERVLAATLPASNLGQPVRSFSDRLDRLLLHPLLGIPMFALIMWLVFQLTTTIATPLVDGIAGFFDGPVTRLLQSITPDGSWVQSLLVNGILTGVGTVLSFTPLLALVFLGITLLEDSGYLARAAYVTDRALRKLGLDGRAMVPLVIGFGCNVPAIAATKTIPDARRRLLTGLLVPLTSCPAMLTIYVLVAAAFFPGHVGSVIFAMYFLSATLVVLGGFLLHKTLFRSLQSTQPLVLALPAYRFPKLKFIIQTCFTRVVDFIKSAGGVIAGVLVLVWLLSAIPAPGAAGRAADVRFAQVPIEYSLYGRAARSVAPALAPAGLDDWRITSALATGFIAKEATVGALAQTLGANEAVGTGAAGVSETGNGSVYGNGNALSNENWLAARFHETLAQSSGGYPTAAAAAFLVLVLANTPCLATVATQRRQFGWRWAAASMGGQIVLAWVLAVLTFQLFRVFT